MPTTNPKLVLFDCDGVLVDSEMISARVFADVIRRAGIDMTPIQALKQFKGGSMGASMEYVESVLGGPASFDIEAAYRKESFEAYHNEMTTVQGIIQILDKLTIPACVASNGPRNKIILNLELTRLNHYFDEPAIFSAYDFDKWKPDPTMFLEAAKSFKCDPEYCLVVGDSPADIVAAKAAGMSSIGYAPMGDYENMSELGAHVISQMEELYQILFTD